VSRAVRTPLPVLSDQTASHSAPAGTPSDLRVGVITLGCDKNTVDSERVQARLAAAGVRVCADANTADVVVVNTCGFIDAAKEESIDTLLAAVQRKKAGKLQAVVAMGCLVQRYKEQLVEELPEVDLFIGLTEIETLIPQLRKRGLLGNAQNMQLPLRRLSTTTRHTSYLKVSEGCDHSCAFCAIPLMRGKHRSAPMEQLVAEAQELEASGVVELNLISQDTTWYGRDLVRGGVPMVEGFVGRPFRGMKGVTQLESSAGAVRSVGPREHPRGLLPQLLDRLLRETSIPWLRLFYMYPSGIQRELVELMARAPRVVPYLDMPIQHGSDRMLERMRRPERRATILERVGWLRSALPDLSLRTTVIVGFPGETDDDFRDLLDLLREVRFDYLGAFAYSIEEDTPAAHMPDQVSAGVKRERLEELLDLQRTITQENNESRIDRTLSVLIDRAAAPPAEQEHADGAHVAIGRTAGQALEVDGVVHIENAEGLEPGSFARVHITDVLDYDLMGRATGRMRAQPA
jgi:ribosomal protein S12 methylthiotransferase